MPNAIADDRITEATIDLGALRANAVEAQRLAGDRALFAVVKADAYGHGAVPVSKALLEAGCQRLVVLTVDEGAALREAQIEAPILLLGGVRTPDEAARAITLDLCPVLHHAGGAELVRAAASHVGRAARVQVEVDTGMSRMGVPCGDAVAFLGAIHEEPWLELDGAFSHFSSADEAELETSLEQTRRFRAVVRAARAQGIELPHVHIANSAGLVAGDALSAALPEATAARPGLMLYGVQPREGAHAALRPVMCLRARVIRVQEVPVGASVGYARTYCVPGRGSASPGVASTRVATVPLGYADGIACATGNRGWVWIAGARHPIAGRVSMDSISIDVGEAEVAVGDEAIVFGNAGNVANVGNIGSADPESGETAGISVEEAAQWSGTIPYELLVRVGNRVPRRFVG